MVIDSLHALWHVESTGWDPFGGRGIIVVVKLLETQVKS